MNFLTPQYQLRVGGIRVLYDVVEQVVEILAVESQKTLYQRDLVD
ncbi:type II toxin-antitoxin system RelE family toxin [Kovacikia minuta]|nr:hypothetical protein [Kovacikia minuta]